ncbi:MAG: NUDIX hydrolase [Rhodospirillales bacterium]|jgi:8-oxo-dGTP pyrophosphatase MutT (NUDIX family)|tara:strand:+ start:614 stop:1138 length:525 start_codon:yes stop_codon:yes gene_type:complete
MKDALKSSRRTQSQKLIFGEDKGPKIVGQLVKQVGCLCYKWVDKKLKVLIITSRTTKRWIIPKGWMQPKLGASGSAAVEAWEEAGVLGICDKKKFGDFKNIKILKDGYPLECIVDVFLMKTITQKAEFPEKDERTVKWIDPEDAASFIRNKSLIHLLKNFDAKKSKLPYGIEGS